MKNLLDLSLLEIENFFHDLGEKSFHGRQVFKWIHQHGSEDFAAMTNLSKNLRQQLPALAQVEAPTVALEKISQDGTIKWLLRLQDGNCIETVFIPEADRGTLCVSSQVGCMLTCRFCATAQQGFSRNLTLSEIIGQVFFARKQLGAGRVTNVVMMGMGEPLLNYDAVVKAMDIMMSTNAYGLSKYRVTLSTSGLVPLMDKLSQQSTVSLAVSLHAPNDPLRDFLVPLNKKYPLETLMAACKRYYQGDKRRQITMEYVMLDGVNDSVQHAKELIRVLEGVPSKVNLIPFNPFPHTQFKRSSETTIQKFREILLKAGLNTITRKTRGADIDAACGQLRGKVFDRTIRSKKFPPIQVVGLE